MPGYNSQRRGTVRTSQFYLFIFYFYVFSVFCVLLVCKCVLDYCHRVSTQLQLKINNNNVPEGLAQVEFCVSRNCVYIVGQQYSSATFVSSRFHSRKENFVARLKMFYHFSFFSLYYLHSHSREKRLSASPCPSVCPSACIGMDLTEQISVQIDIANFYENLSSNSILC
jgi:hypothetical protein